MTEKDQIEKLIKDLALCQQAVQNIWRDYLGLTCNTWSKRGKTGPVYKNEIKKSEEIST